MEVLGKVFSFALLLFLSFQMSTLGEIVLSIFTPESLEHSSKSIRPYGSSAQP